MTKASDQALIDRLNSQMNMMVKPFEDQKIPYSEFILATLGTICRIALLRSKKSGRPPETIIHEMMERAVQMLDGMKNTNETEH